MNRMKKSILLLALFLLAGLASCQARLQAVIHNESGSQISVEVDKITYALPDGAEIVVKSPADRRMILRGNGVSYRFELPFGPRPHTTSPYIDMRRFLIRIQIRSIGELLIPPLSSPNLEPTLSIVGRIIQ